MNVYRHDFGHEESFVEIHLSRRNIEFLLSKLDANDAYMSEPIVLKAGVMIVAQENDAHYNKDRRSNA